MIVRYKNKWSVLDECAALGKFMGLSLRLVVIPYHEICLAVHCLAHLHQCLGDWLVAGQTHLFVESPRWYSR